MLEFAFMRNALLVSLSIAVLCPTIGIFLVLRRESLIGDTLAHASLAGVACGLLFGSSPVLSAFIFTSSAGACIQALRSWFRRSTDLILSIVLAMSVGAALTITGSGRVHANLDAFLYGSILTVDNADLASAAALSVFAVVGVAAFYNELLCITYDEDAARVAGARVTLINYVFAILVAAAISVSIRVVGVLVISSMISLPVATALQLHRGFRRTLFASVAFSLVDMGLGLIGSWRLGTAPGGLTALMSGLMLVGVIATKELLRLLRRTTR